MNPLIAALPMYDWPERRAEVDAEWHRLRDALHAGGIDAPAELTRPCNDLFAVWRDPRLLFAQTCWGPMQTGLQDHVQLVGQPDYSDCEGGKGAFYSSVILMRAGDAGDAVAAPADGTAQIPVALLRGKRFAYNDPLSMSGLLALSNDLEALGAGLDIFTPRIMTGAHRASIRSVAARKADVCAIDCRSWMLAQAFEPAARHLRAVGWTARRPGLPYITARDTPDEAVALLRRMSAVSPASAPLPDRTAAAY
ncbi:phosphate/phosphite/phosphonate ABC transporter substrate-binding protein [Nitratireductor soli]|uniref:phosphate/phosphite/phosphonate ABC transporter substrate-binding protein n=1 Tax=Nitratireductor soli TaxID=1670619 RepID=UPI00065E7D55|nr:PhnD/SsuA/transferrin family substrate-binding protein [Nitratireductor soli]